MIVVKGYMKCKVCGTIFTPSILSPPCYGKDDDKIPSELCVLCEKFVDFKAKPLCPSCGSSKVKKITGLNVRLTNYFRK